MDYQTKLNFIIPESDSLSLNYQTKILGISRSHFYYQPVPISQEEIKTMGYMDKIFTECPMYGSRKIKEALAQEPYNIFICREQVQRLMREMGLQAIYPKPKKGLSDPNLQHLKYPYLLKNLKINRPNQVWGTDITYIKLANGFCYLVAIIDWFSRYVVAWTLSDSLNIDFVLSNLEKALNINIPEIFNSDQGSHFTSPQHTDILKKKDIAISMDGRGRCMDNIFTERLWRSAKYENIYLHEYQSLKEVEAGLTLYFEFYNYKRIHQSLNYQTPAKIYFNN